MASRTTSRRMGVRASLVALLLPAALAAQAPAAGAPLRLSFADAVRVARSEAPAVALAGLRTDEAAAGIRRARAALLPAVSLGGSWLNRTFNSKSLGIDFRFPTDSGQPPATLPELIGPFNLYDARVSASQALLDWSSVARVRAARAQADGSRADRGVTVEGTALTAALAYLRAVRAQAVVAAPRDSVVAAGLTNRPDLRAELARAGAARQTGAAIRAERLPRLEVAADYGVNGRTVPGAISTRDLTLQVSVPILDGFRREARLAEQDAVVRESQVRERDLRQQIAADVDGSLLDLHSAEAQQAVATERLRLAAQELSQSRERFKAGVAGNIEVIDAQSNLIRARDTDIDARFAAASAHVSLARAAGVARTLH